MPLYKSTARKFTIGDTSREVNGVYEVSWDLDDLNAAARSGLNAFGDWDINILGTAPKWETPRAFTIGNNVKFVDGSGNVSWSLSDIGAAAVNQSMFIGTTEVPINRTSGALTLAGLTLTTPNIGAATGTSLLATGEVSGAYLGVENTTSTNGYGISLYGGGSAGQPTYGIMFQGTATFGTYGPVTADWATYFTMNNTAGRGWIFKTSTGTAGNVAGINTVGDAQFAGNLTIGGRMQTSGNQTVAAWTTTGQSFDSAAATFTDNTTAAAGTVATRAVNSFNTPTLASTNAITVTNAATVYIANRPTAGTNTTITNGYALWVAAGNSLFAGNITTSGSLNITGTTQTDGHFYAGTTNPTGTTRLNYSGYLYPTFLNLIGSSDTATAATHYFVETGSDGFVRPKTLANVQSEIVTSAVLGSGTANSTTFLRGDRTWTAVSLPAGQTAGSATTGYLTYNGTTSLAGALYGGTTNPSGTTRLNYAGNLHVNELTAVGNVTAFSDIKLKTDLSQIANALEKVKQLTGYTYTRTDTGERQTGLIAQDVQKVLPEAVLDGDTLALAYGNMVGLLVEAIKEQQSIIEDQEKRLRKLEETKLGK